ncbi:MAG: GxxExxY protein [Lacunisphaera sp.]
MKFGNINKLCYLVRETSFAIHRHHRDGRAENIYEHALAHRLRKQGIEVRQQHPLSVFDDDGKISGNVYADLLVEGQLVVELRAARAIGSERVAQVFDYFHSLRIETGLLINFGAPVLLVKKYLLSGPHLFWCLFAAYWGEQVIW